MTASTSPATRQTLRRPGIRSEATVPQGYAVRDSASPIDDRRAARAADGVGRSDRVLPAVVDAVGRQRVVCVAYAALYPLLRRLRRRQQVARVAYAALCPLLSGLLGATGQIAACPPPPRAHRKRNHLRGRCRPRHRFDLPGEVPSPVAPSGSLTGTGASYGTVQHPYVP